MDGWVVGLVDGWAGRCVGRWVDGLDGWIGNDKMDKRIDDRWICG